MTTALREQLKPVLERWGVIQSFVGCGHGNIVVDIDDVIAIELTDKVIECEGISCCVADVVFLDSNADVVVKVPIWLEPDSERTKAFFAAMGR